MIHFRCPACGKLYMVKENRAGERLDCSCGQHLKVPRRSGASAKYRTWGDLFVEVLVYGVAGALLGFLLGVVIVSQTRMGLRRAWVLLLGLSAAGLLVGTFGGEGGINWIGRKIRDREQR